MFVIYLSCTRPHYFVNPVTKNHISGTANPVSKISKLKINIGRANAGLCFCGYSKSIQSNYQYEKSVQYYWLVLKTYINKWEKGIGHLKVKYFC